MSYRISALDPVAVALQHELDFAVALSRISNHRVDGLWQLHLQEADEKEMEASKTSCTALTLESLLSTLIMSSVLRPIDAAA